MRMIYIVTGHTGVYEDRETWIEGAYTTREEAIGRVDQLNKILESLGCYDAEMVDYLDYDRESELTTLVRNSHDSNFRLEYNGAHYSYESVVMKKLCVTT